MSNVDKIQQTINTLKEKNNKFFFFVQDTKGNAKASIKYIYDIILALKSQGKNAIALFEEKNYTSHKDWLGDAYSEVEETYINGNSLKVSVEDFLILPEIFGYIMEQVKDMPCGKIVLTQAYDQIFETLKPGETWQQFGFFKTITTTEILKSQIRDLFSSTSVDVLPVLLSDYVEKKTLPPNPIIAIHSREQRDSLNFIKTFYQKYPQYRWFSFRDMRGLSLSEFAEPLKESCVSVWIDDRASFGTFPLESMACGTPVIGKIPHLNSQFISEDNGIWSSNLYQMVDILADYVKNWLEDNINEKLIDEGLTTASTYQDKESFETKTNELFDSYISSRIENLESQLNKLEPIENE